MTPAERARFDSLLEEAIDQLPARLHGLLEEVPLVVDDQPDAALTRELFTELGHEEGETLEEFSEGLCGLHSGVPLTETSVEHSGIMPGNIRIFREGIVWTAGGWEAGDGESDDDVDDAIYDEIAITLLHEIGHHFGLGEQDLEELGYG